MPGYGRLARPTRAVLGASGTSIKPSQGTKLDPWFHLMHHISFQKMAATLRHNQMSGSGPVYLKIDMTSGHFSASDRYKYLKEIAFQYAFVLDQIAANSDTCSTKQQ